VLVACLAAGATTLVMSAPPPDPRPAGAALAARQDIRIELNGPGGRQLRFGLPDIVVAPGDLELKSAAATIADVLWNDLDFEEEFYMIRREASASVPVTAVIADLPVTRWAELGADYVVVGSAQRSGTKLTVEIRLVGVRGDAARKIVNGEGVAYNCVVTSPRACAHAISDSLHKLHGIDGVAQTRLAFVSDRGGELVAGALSRGSKEIYISDYDGANQQAVTANRRLNISPSWSPDGNLLAYVSYGPDGPDVYVKSVYEAKQAWRPAVGGLPNYFPAFSPDGTKIAFASSRDSAGLYQLFVVDRDGKTPPRRITNSRSADYVPTWSPDGTKIAFASDRTGQGTPRIYVTSADGVGLEVLPCTSKCDRPSWSPTGEMIAFTCGTGQPGYDICTINLRTREVATLTDGTGVNEQPFFAPNGRHIVFSTTRYGKSQIAIIDIKGKLQRRITEVGNNSFPSWSHARR
jgi:TolB protein